MQFTRKPETVAAWPISDILEFAPSGQTHDVAKLSGRLARLMDDRAFFLTKNDMGTVVEIRDGEVRTWWRAGWMVVDEDDNVECLQPQEFYEKYEVAS